MYLPQHPYALQVQALNTNSLTADILGRNSGRPIAASILLAWIHSLHLREQYSVRCVGNTFRCRYPVYKWNCCCSTYTAGPVGGAGSAIATADNQVITANITIPLPPAITPVSPSVCHESSDNVVNGPAGASTYAWSISGGTITSGTANQNIIYTAGDSSPVVLLLTITTGIGCTLSNTDSITSSLTNVLSGTPGGAQVCVSYTISEGGTTYADGSCNPIAKVVPSGTEPVSGMVNTCVKIDSSVQGTTSQHYVQRHYDITPNINPATSTATLTLYFTQEEFDSFNTVRGTYPALPASSA